MKWSRCLHPVFPQQRRRRRMPGGPQGRWKVINPGNWSKVNSRERDELVLGSDWQSKSFSIVYIFPYFNMIFQKCHADYCSLSLSLDINLLLAYLYRKLISSDPIGGLQLWYSINMRFPVLKGRMILWFFFPLLLLELLSSPKEYVQYTKK